MIFAERYRARRFEEGRKKGLEEARKELREEGRQEARKERDALWSEWLKRHDTALANNEEFNEPSPSAGNRSNNKQDEPQQPRVKTPTANIHYQHSRRKAMVYQLRIYTINRGMMDSWLKVFNEHIRPLHDRLGIPVQNSWVNADRTEFIWVRRFNNSEEIPVKEAEYFASPERTALADTPTSHIAKMEVRVIEGVEAAVA